MVVLLATLFLSAVVQLSAGIVSPWHHRSIFFPVPEHSESSRSSFSLQDNVVGKDFLTFFYWETEDDPTHGRVNYVDQGAALARGLVEVASNSFIMRVDDTNVVPAGARGRDSNRITSHKQYTDSVVVLDIKHVPFGCATWPAFWTVDLNQWPSGGEIDIIEGVNNVQTNFATLHTATGCTMPQTRSQNGSTVSTDCSAAHNGNQGCVTAITSSGSYGDSLNNMGGGWYVMKRTQADGVYVWFWGRNDPSVPDAVRLASNDINPDDSWGMPDARFPSTSSCEFSNYFKAHQLVFDTTFCGDYAGGVYSQTCGPDSCEAYVNDNPQAFKDAYWEINALRMYTPSVSHSDSGGLIPI